MDYDALRFWLEIMIVIFTGGNIVYTYISNKQRANKGEIDRLSEEVTMLIRRTSVHEDRLRSAPTHDDIGKIYERMNTVGNRLEKMSGSMEAMITQLTLINEHLMKGGN